MKLIKKIWDTEMALPGKGCQKQPGNKTWLCFLHSAGSGKVTYFNSFIRLLYRRFKTSS